MVAIVLQWFLACALVFFHWCIYSILTFCLTNSGQPLSREATAGNGHAVLHKTTIVFLSIYSNFIVTLVNVVYCVNVCISLVLL